MESINFDFQNKVLTVTNEDGTKKEYTDSDSYLKDWPERVADCKSIGWL